MKDLAVSQQAPAVQPPHQASSAAEALAAVMTYAAVPSATSTPSP